MSIYHNGFEQRNTLVCGATKQGKTTFLKYILKSLLDSTDSEKTNIIILDTKTGKEYDEFQGRSKVYHRLTEIESVLAALLGRIYSRYRGESSELKMYLFIDEYSDLVPDVYMSEEKKALLEITHRTLSAIARLGPQKGVYVILSTYGMNERILPSSLLADFRDRICFRTVEKEECDLIFPEKNVHAEKLHAAGEFYFNIDDSVYYGDARGKI